MDFVNINDGKVLKVNAVSISLTISNGMITDGGVPYLTNKLPQTAGNAERRFETIPILEVYDSTGSGISAVVLPILKNITGEAGVGSYNYELIGFEIKNPGKLYKTATLLTYDCTATASVTGVINGGEWKNYKTINVTGNVTINPFSLSNPDGGKLKLQAIGVNINNNITAQNTGWRNTGATALTEFQINILDYIFYWPLQKPTGWTWVNTGTAEPAEFTNFNAIVAAYNLNGSHYKTVNNRKINANSFKVLKDINPNLLEIYEWPSAKPTTWTWVDTGTAEPVWSSNISGYITIWNLDGSHYEDTTVYGINSTIVPHLDWEWVNNGTSEPATKYLSSIATALLETNSYYRFKNIDINASRYSGNNYFVDDSNDAFPAVSGLSRPLYTLDYNVLGNNFVNNRKYISYLPDFKKWAVTSGTQYEYAQELTSTLTGTGAKFRFAKFLNDHPCYVNAEGFYLYYDSGDMKFHIKRDINGSDVEVAISESVINGRIISDHLFKVNPNGYTSAMWPANPSSIWTWINLGTTQRLTLSGATAAYNGDGSHWQFNPARTEDPNNEFIGSPTFSFISISDFNFVSLINGSYYSSYYPYYEMHNFTTNIIRKRVWNRRDGGYNDDSISGGYDSTLLNNRIFRYDEMNSMMGSGGTDLVAGGGNICIQAENITLSATKTINVSSTSSSGSGGTITLMARNSLTLNGTLNTTAVSGKNGLTRVFCHPNHSPTLTGNNKIFSTVSTPSTTNLNYLFGQIENFPIKQLSATPQSGPDYGEYTNLGDTRSEFIFSFPWTSESSSKYINLAGITYRCAVQQSSATYLNRVSVTEINNTSYWKTFGINTLLKDISVYTVGILLDGSGNLSSTSLVDGNYYLRVIGEYQYYKDWNSLIITTQDDSYDKSVVKIFKIYDSVAFANSIYVPPAMPDILGPSYVNYKYLETGFSSNIITNKNDIVTIRIQQIPVLSNPTSDIYRVGEHLLITVEAEEV